MERLFFICSLLFFVCTTAFNQNDKITISIVEFNIPSLSTIQQLKSRESPDNPYKSSGLAASNIHSKISSLQKYVTEVFNTDSRFIVVDRSSSDVVQQERELQKMEDFLDGYVVAQGKALGADYLVSGEFDALTTTLSLSLYSVANGVIISSEALDLKEPILGFFDQIKEPTVVGTRRLIQKEFPTLMPVVKVLEEKKDKAKVLLIGGGLNLGLKKGNVLDLKVLETIDLDGKSKKYYKTIGQVEVEKVEGQNFSIVNVKDGEKETKSLFDSGQKLYAFFKIGNE